MNGVKEKARYLIKKPGKKNKGCAFERFLGESFPKVLEEVSRGSKDSRMQTGRLRDAEMELETYCFGRRLPIYSFMVGKVSKIKQ